MASAILAVAVLGLLIGVTVVLRWRLLGMEFRRRDLRRVGVVPRQTNRVRPYAAHVFGQQSLPLFGSPRNNASAFAPLISKEQRAEAFLERILALTGAKKVDGSYVLNVATVQFQVRDRFIRRLQNPNDPKSPYEETCFYLVHNGMPKVEEIATALRTSRTIPRCLTSGLFKTEWRSKPTAKSSTAVRCWASAEKKFPDPLSLVFAPDGLTCELGPSVG